MNDKLKAGAIALVAVVALAGIGVVLLGDSSGGGKQQQVGSPGDPAHPTRSPRDIHAPSPFGSGPGGVVTPELPGVSPRPGASPGASPGGSPTGPGPGPSASPAQGGPTELVLLCEDERGQPLANVRVEAQRARSGMPLEPVMTDASGRARLRGLPEGELVRGVARHPRVADAVAFGPVPAGRGEVRLRLEQARLGRLRGRIQDETGQPVTQAELLLVNPKEQEGAAVLDTAALGLGPDGSFLVDVAAGAYAVSARGPGLTESDRTYVTVPAEGEAPELLLKVTRMGAISGRLDLPADVAQRRPLELDVVLEIKGGTERNPLTRVDRRPLRPGPDLSFTLEGLTAGAVRMRLELPAAGDHRVGPWLDVQLDPAQRRTGVVLSLQQSVAVSVQGTVRDDEGVVVRGALVEVNNRRATSDLDGAYAVRGIDPGDVGIKVTKAGHAPAFVSKKYEGATLTVDVVLQRMGSVRGRVSGSVIAGVPVTAVHNEDGAVETYSGTSDAQGNYTIEGVPPGNYYLKAGKGVDLFEPAGAPTVSVSSGKPTQAPELKLP
ncbi:MAG: carboxypeptidase regulatory-like domain-containing protein [Planctomycetota bacterium]